MKSQKVRFCVKKVLNTVIFLLYYKLVSNFAVAMTKFRKIVLNVPHSSIDKWGEGWDSPDGIWCHVKDFTDWYTDILFHNDMCSMVRFPCSRFYCDAERLKNDPMEKIGQGICYTSYGDFKRVKVPDVMGLWQSHQEALSKEIVEGTLLIDCHSFPSKVCDDVDICIGFNSDWSKPSDDVLSVLINAFEGMGLRVGINHPYSNSITPDCDIKYQSVMIEVNKRVYMNEGTLLPISDAFERFKSLLGDIYKQLLQ